MRARVGGALLEPLRFDGSYPIQGDALLELFADGRALGPEHRVYEYRAHEESCTVAFAPMFFGGETCRARTRYLWVLVDEGSERVVAARGALSSDRG
jgi:hypothetical protein